MRTTFRNFAKRVAPSTVANFTPAVSTDVTPWVTLVPVPRDYQQSVASAPFENAAIAEYCHEIDRINKAGAAIVRGIEVAGGAIGWQMLAMDSRNPMDLQREFLRATPNGTDLLSLGRGQAGPALNDLHDNTLYRFYRHQAETMREFDASFNPGVNRNLCQRFFQFNDNEFQKEVTRAIETRLHTEGFDNFRLIDSTVYTDNKPLKLIATRVANAMEESLLRNGAAKGIEVEVKDFAGSMTPEKAAKLQELIAKERDKKVKKYADQPEFVSALKNAKVGFHVHRTHFSEHTGKVLVEGAAEHKLHTVIHCISKVRNTSHLPIEDLIVPMRDAGIGITTEQEKIIDGARAALEKARKAHEKLIVMPGNDACTPPKGDHLAGGGLPSRKKFAAVIATEQKISEQAALKLLEDKLHKLRTDNTIALVTPALFNMTTLAFHMIQNEAKKLPSYSGQLPEGAVDTIRNLDPKTVKDKELLEVCYKQHRSTALEELVRDKKITKEVAASLSSIGLDSKKLNLDSKATIKILNAAGVSKEVQDVIIEAGKPLTKKATNLKDEVKEAEATIDRLVKEGKLANISREDAVVIVSTLGQGGIGLKLVTNPLTPEEIFARKLAANDPVTCALIDQHARNGAGYFDEETIAQFPTNKEVTLTNAQRLLAQREAALTKESETKKSASR